MWVLWVTLCILPRPSYPSQAKDSPHPSFTYFVSFGAPHVCMGPSLCWYFNRSVPTSNVHARAATELVWHYCAWRAMDTYIAITGSKLAWRIDLDQIRSRIDLTAVRFGLVGLRQLHAKQYIRFCMQLAKAYEAVTFGNQLIGSFCYICSRSVHSNKVA